MNTKSSRTMRYLETHEVFTLEEFLSDVDVNAAERTRYENLQNAVERGQAYRLKRGLYASSIGVYRDRVPNVFLVAAKAAPDAIVSHHSALEAHGVAHSPFRTVYFTSMHKVGDFHVRGYRFHRVAPPAMSDPLTSLEEFHTRVRAGEAIVRVTTKERTLVDCLRNLKLAGGLEELFRSLGGLTSMSTELVARYLSLLDSPTLTARTGWVMGHFAQSWRIDMDVLDEMRASVGRGTYRLQTGRTDQEFVSQWRLYVPKGLPFEEWVTG